MRHKRAVGSERRARTGAIVLELLIAVLLILPTSSCKLIHTRAVSELDFANEPAGSDLAVAAHFTRDTDGAPRFFREILPDSGVVAVFVGVRNNGNLPLVIFSSNGMELEQGFDGFVLAANGKRYLPLHPKDVVERILGIRKAGRYRRTGGFGIVLGTIMPPAGAYFIYNEVDVGRFYRPLFSRSLFPALPSGLLRPIELAPGETKSGFLYFDVGTAAVSDSVVGTDFRGKTRSVRIPFEGTTCDLYVEPCIPIAARDTIPGYDFSFTAGSLFVLRRAPGGKTELLRAPVGTDARSPLGAFETLMVISSKTASIAAAAVRGDTAAVAVNFKSKSKVYLIELGAPARVLGEQTFSRGIDRVFLSEAGILVQTSDGFCRLLSAENVEQTAYVRLGAEVDDTAVMGDRLLAFQRTRGLALFGASRGNALESLGGRGLPKGRRRVVGFLDDKLVILSRGKETEGDTITLFLKDNLSEIRRMELAGRAREVVSDGSSLLVQLEDGTLLRLAPAPLARLAVAEAAYLPFAARALACMETGFIAVGHGGILAAGPLGDYAPGSRGMFDVVTTVR
jgi:hypothetical protein